MINFVNNGTDEAILKSLSTEECSEDLIKAMNKQGLVQKDVTVQGKNGKTFTRKQWVKASDVKGSGSQSSPHQSTSTKVVGRFKPSDFQFRAGGQQVVDFVNSLDTEFGVEKLVNGSVGFGTLTLKDGDKVGFGYDDKGAYAVWNGQRFRSASDLAKNWGKTSKSSDKKTLDTAHFESIKSDKAKALEYLKNCGVQWTENSHAGINWMRAMAAYKAATGGQKSTQKASSTPTQPTSQATTSTAQVAQNTQGNNGTKMSKEDAKKKTQSFTSKVGKTDAERKVFMDKVKAQGITWKDKADDGSDVAIGVSWMRCCMAMNKHFAEGGSFDDSDKQPQQPVKNVTVQQYDNYNERRYSKPWIALVDSKGKIDFSKNVGDYSGRPGEAGELYVYEPQEGQVYAYGQKDNRGNNGGYSYLKFVNGKFEPIDKSQLTASLAQSGKNVVLETYDSYNSRRYSKPWVAKVDSKGKPDFSEDVGKFSGQPGESGEIYVYEPVDGQVYMFGQKDYRGGNTVSKYVVFTGGKFQEIDKKQLTTFLSKKDSSSTNNNNFSKKTTTLLEGFDSEFDSDDSLTLEEFSSSSVMRYASSIVNRLEQLDEQGADVTSSDEDIKSIKAEFDAVYKRFKQLRTKASELEKKLPGSNWSTLPSGSSERSKAVDEYDKSKKLRDKVDKKLYPDGVEVSFFMNGL